MIKEWNDCLVNEVPTVKCIEVVLGRLIYLSVGFLIIIFFAVLVFGSLKYLISGGNLEKLKKAQSILLWGIIGMVVFITSFLMLKTIDTLFLAGQNKLFSFNIPHDINNNTTSNNVFTFTSQLLSNQPQTTLFTTQNPTLQASPSLTPTFIPTPFLPIPTSVLRPEPNPTSDCRYSINDFLPDLIPENTEKSILAQNEFKKAIGRYPDNIVVYKKAEELVCVPWQVLAGVHWVEGDCERNRSLVSGRFLGQAEPDVMSAGNCTSMRSGIGVPIPVRGGCGFATLLDSAVYTGRHLKTKVFGKINNFRTMVLALSRYNGSGNANCGRSPYPNCPPDFLGEDHPNVLSLFSERHDLMYIVYCADHLKCLPPKTFKKAGVLTIAKMFSLWKN